LRLKLLKCVAYAAAIGLPACGSLRAADETPAATRLVEIHAELKRMEYQQKGGPPAIRYEQPAQLLFRVELAGGMRKYAELNPLVRVALEAPGSSHPTVFTANRTYTGVFDGVKTLGLTNQEGYSEALVEAGLSSTLSEVLSTFAGLPLYPLLGKFDIPGGELDFSSVASMKPTSIGEERSRLFEFRSAGTQRRHLVQLSAAGMPVSVVRKWEDGDFEKWKIQGEFDVGGSTLEYSYFTGGANRGTVVVTLKRVTVRPTRDDDFTAALPKGTLVRDKIQNLSYPAGKSPASGPG
jgi:hypothetical protein